MQFGSVLHGPPRFVVVCLNSISSMLPDRDKPMDRSTTSHGR